MGTTSPFHQAISKRRSTSAGSSITASCRHGGRSALEQKRLLLHGKLTPSTAAVTDQAIRRPLADLVVDIAEGGRVPLRLNGQNGRQLESKRVAILNRDNPPDWCTATSTSLVRLRGRCPRGERLVGSVPHGHWKTITLVVGLRHDGMVAPFVIDGPMNGTIFLAYVEQCLAPTLHRRDVVVMDNLPAHKVAGVADAIEAVGARAFYLPPYSPDLNPIEQVFSKLKALLRKAAERTVPKLWRRIRALLRTITGEECLNFFRHVGYASI